MSVNIDKVEEFLTSELKLSQEESKAFLFIVKNGRNHTEKIAQALKFSEEEASKAAKSLVEKGMIINISLSEYESLHPRFAISNRYRRLCEENNMYLFYIWYNDKDPEKTIRQELYALGLIN